MNECRTLLVVFFRISLLLVLSSGMAVSQEPTVEASPLSTAETEEVTDEIEMDSAAERMVASLKAQLEAIQIKRQDVLELESELAAGTNEVSRKAIVEKLQKATNELGLLELNFRETAAGNDFGLFEEKVEEPFSLERELGKVAEPLFAGIEEATATSRKISDLREKAELFTEQAEASQQAIASIEGLLMETQSIELQAALEEQLEMWREKENFAGNQAESALLQLEVLEGQQEGFVESSTKYVRNFVQQRGLNLILGVGAALAVFFFVRGILFVARKFRKTENPKNFGSRVFVLTANLLSVLGGLAAMMAVFSVTGDVILFSFVLLFLLGVAWGGIKVLPQFMESFKLILNIGMVKEDEKIIFDDIPWTVSSLGFSCRLENRLLDNAIQVLPVRHLVGHHSRPWCEGEKEFPCKTGEWVQLSDGRIGKTLHQNPGHVLLEEWGGARVTIGTPEFLALAPRNLSESSFRVETRFGIDYEHQADCTSAIPQKMAAAVQKGLSAILAEELIEKVSVEFAMAGASSLDYEVEVDLKGAAAEKYEKVQYALQRILVDCCNENGWGIPFQQITLHRAEG